MKKAKTILAEPLCDETRFLRIIDAASASRCFMHHREIAQAATATRELLGQDTLAETKQAEFDALPVSEQERMRAAKDFGEYGVFHLASRPEIRPALLLAAKEMFPDREALTPDDVAEVQEMAEAISARFPAMDQARITRILALVR